VCKELQGVVRGNQPEGHMQFYRRRDCLPGYNGNITLKSLTIKGVTKNHNVLMKDLPMIIFAEIILT